TETKHRAAHKPTSARQLRREYRRDRQQGRERSRPPPALREQPAYRVAAHPKRLMADASATAKFPDGSGLPGEAGKSAGQFHAGLLGRAPTVAINPRRCRKPSSSITSRTILRRGVCGNAAANSAISSAALLGSRSARQAAEATRSRWWIVLGPGAATKISPPTSRVSTPGARRKRHAGS